MPRLHHHSACDYREMPWKNGLGTTREIYAAPAPDGDFRWRLSIASIDQSGPFSALPGYNRIFTLIAGKGTALTIHGEASARQKSNLAPQSFSGDLETACQLKDGPARAFNLIAQSGLPVSVTPVNEAGFIQLPKTGITAFFAAEGSPTCQIGDQKFTLQTEDCLIVEDQPGLAELIPPADAFTILLVSIRHKAA